MIEDSLTKVVTDYGNIALSISVCGNIVQAYANKLLFTELLKVKDIMSSLKEVIVILNERLNNHD